MRLSASARAPAGETGEAAEVAEAHCAPDAGLRCAWAWGPPLASLVALAALLVADANRALFLYINRAGRALGQDVWLELTLLGDGAVALILLLPLVRRAPQRFWAGIVAACVAAAWTQGIKHALDLPRPSLVFDPASFIHAGPDLHRAAFPSGHAAAAFALAGIWVMSVRGRVARLGLLLSAALIAVSRVMVGVHWPADILGGMLGGWCGAWIGLAMAARHGWDARGWPALAAALVLLALCAALLVRGGLDPPGGLPLARLLALACLAGGIRDVAVLLSWRRAARNVSG